MIGDTLEADILGAHNVGMVGIWITRRAELNGDRSKGDGIQPDAVIGSLKELPQVLENLNGK